MFSVIILDLTHGFLLDVTKTFKNFASCILFLTTYTRAAQPFIMQGRTSPTRRNNGCCTLQNSKLQLYYLNVVCLAIYTVETI